MAPFTDNVSSSSSSRLPILVLPCDHYSTLIYTNNIFPNIFSDLSVSHLVYNFYFFTNNWRFPIFICGLKQRVIITRWALTLFDRTYWHETAIQRINFSKYSLSNVSRMGINSSATYSLTWTKDSSRSQDSIIWKNISFVTLTIAVPSHQRREGSKMFQGNIIFQPLV